MMHALIEHFRCPEDLFELRLTGALGDDAGFFRCGPRAICYGRSASGFRLPDVSGSLHDAGREVTADGRSVGIPFDPDEVVDNLRHERYRRPGPRGAGHEATLRRLYYSCVRPLLPSALRRAVQRAALRGWHRIPFPEWPVDATVEQLLEALLALAMQGRGLHRVPFVWFWPDGARSCVTMTHDVDTRSGRDFCSALMTLDAAAGITSSFQIVPESRYRVSESFLDEFRARGFEINVHDLNHDGRLFDSHDEFVRRARRINEYGRRFRALGFRSGTLYRNLAWYAALEFSYDMSVPSVAHLDPQKGGCCTVSPFFIGEILELPLTTTQDYSLFHIVKDYSLDLWTRQLRAITVRHGLASFNAHPECLLEPRARSTYRALLDHLARARERDNVWVARPGEVDRWWRDRRHTTVVADGGGWRIRGPAAPRARLAFATVEDGALTFAVEGAGSSGCRGD